MNLNRLKNKYASYGVALGLFIILALVVFRCALGGGNAFSASDAHISRIAGVQPSLTQLVSPSYDGYLLGGLRYGAFSPYTLLRALLSPYLFNDLYAPMTLVASSFFLFLFLRMRGRSWGASFLGAVSAFWLGSATLASAGHYGKLGTACFFSLSLILLEKALLVSGVRKLCWAILCGTSVGFMLLSQQDIGLLFGLVLGPYALFRLVQESGKKLQDWLMVLVPIATLGLMFSAGTALHAYKANIVQASTINESAEEKWDFITQWSQPPQELPDLLSPGLMGWNTGNPDAPYWGRTGQSPLWTETNQGFRNFRLDSVYLGLVPVLLSIAALIFLFRRNGGADSKERAVVWFWWIMALALLFLAFGKFNPLYRLIIELPLIGSIRAPIKFLHNLGVVFGILAAYGVDALLIHKQERRVPGIVALSFAGVFLLTGLVCMISGETFEGMLSSWGDAAPLIVKRLVFGSFYAAVSAGLFGLFLFKLDRGKAGLFCGLLCLFPLVDSIYLTNHYFRAEDLVSMRRSNVVMDYLKENQGEQKVFTFRRDGIYNRWIGVDFPLHGINGFWFWQAPRLSSDYKNYLSAGNANIVSLLQSTSVKYALVPVGVLNQLPKDVFKPVMFYRFGMDAENNLIVQSMARPERAQDQVLLELQQTLPRISLFHGWEKVLPEKMNEVLFSKEHNVIDQVLVDADLPSPSGKGFVEPKSVEWKTSSVKVQVDAEKDGVLLFTQHFQPQWKAYIDGEEASVFRANGLSMGVHVSEGSKEIVLKVIGRRTGTLLQGAGLIVTLSVMVFLMVSRRREQ